MDEFIFEISSEDDTCKAAQFLAKNLKPGDIVLLNGNLGSGKTFFVKEVLKYLNYNDVTSPTFSIVNEYDADIKCYHFDFYRIKNEMELHDIGISDYLADSEAISFIEWAEMFPSIVNNYNYLVQIQLNNEQRMIIIRKYK